jgi:hypothetical protein
MRHDDEQTREAKERNRLVAIAMERPDLLPPDLVPRKVRGQNSRQRLAMDEIEAGILGELKQNQRHRLAIQADIAAMVEHRAAILDVAKRQAVALEDIAGALRLMVRRLG